MEDTDVAAFQEQREAEKYMGTMTLRIKLATNFLRAERQ
jgi:hypothetical protein